MARDKGDGVDVERLRSAVANVKTRSKMALLRQIMPELERKEREGARAADLVAALAGAGLEMSVGTFWKYRSRWRAEQRRVRGQTPAAKIAAEPAREAIEAPAAPLSDVILDERSGPDYERTKAMLDPKKRDEFAAQFIEAPLGRWLRKKRSIDE